MAFFNINPKIVNLAPPGFSNHSFTLCGSKVVVFGGNTVEGEYFNDVYFYDLIENSWTKPSTLNNTQRPELRSRHSAHFLPPNQILIYAGEQNGFIYDDMHLFNIDSNIWEKINVIGQKPSPRFGFSFMNMSTKSIMIIAGFGGSSSLAESNNLCDIFILNTDTFFWDEYYYKQNGIEPSGLGFTSYTLSDNKTIISIGLDLFSVRVINLEEHLWKEVKANGFAPNDLKGYSLANLDNNEFYLFGGEFNEEVTNDSYFLELADQSFKWSQILITGLKPENRKFHKSVNIGGLVLIFGGEDKENNFANLKAFDLSKMLEWKESNTIQEQDPIFRVQHIMIHIPDMNKILIHGGNCVGLELKDIQLYDYENEIWEHISIKQRAICGHAGVYWEQKRSVIIYGGGSYSREDGFDKDVSILQLNKWNYGEITVLNPPALKLGNRNTGLTMFLYEDKIYTVGGFIPKFGYTMEVYSLSLPHGKEISKWEKISLLTPRKLSPIPRACHSMCRIKNKVFMIGGVKDGIALNDIWYIELESMSWYPVTVYLKYNESLYGACAIPISDFNILVFGGSKLGEKSSIVNAKNDVLLLNFDRHSSIEKEKNSEMNEGIWSVLKIKGKFEPRMFHTGVKVMETIYIFGGCKSSKMALLKIEAQNSNNSYSIKDLMNEEQYKRLTDLKKESKGGNIIENIFSIFKKDPENAKKEQTVGTEYTYQTVNTEHNTEIEEGNINKKAKKKGKKKKKKEDKPDIKNSKKMDIPIKEVNDEYDPWALKEDEDAFAGVYLGGDNLKKDSKAAKSKSFVNPDEDVAMILEND